MGGGSGDGGQEGEGKGQQLSPPFLGPLQLSGTCPGGLGLTVAA